jgi:hypothetical protein
MTDSSGARWYVRDRIGGQPRQLWKFDGRTATQAYVTNPQAGAGTFFEANPGEDIWDSIGRQTPWLDPNVTEGRFYPMILAPGEFYPRMARPLLLATKPTLWCLVLMRRGLSLPTREASLRCSRGNWRLSVRRFSRLRRLLTYTAMRFGILSYLRLRKSRRTAGEF